MNDHLRNAVEELIHLIQLNSVTAWEAAYFVAIRHNRRNFNDWGQQITQINQFAQLLLIGAGLPELTDPKNSRC